MPPYEANAQRKADIWRVCGARIAPVVNCTPGSYKDYFLRVPNDMHTAKQAVAWTFGLAETEYQPSIES